MSISFILLWLSQFGSDLGSSMTSFAITIWAYQQTGSSLTLSISSIFIMLPRMVGGVISGPLVDRMNKKTVMLVTDIGQGLCSLALFYLLWSSNLEIWHIYCLNFISSILGSFKLPANEAAISYLIPKEHYVRASGMQSFSSGTVQVLSPMLAAALLGFVGMPGIMIFDCITMLFASITLLLFIKIPHNIHQHQGSKALNLTNYINDLKRGMEVIKNSKLLTTLLLFLSFINLVAGMTYYSLLSPMILARTGNNANTLALVNGSIGLGGIAGGLIVYLLPSAKSKIKTLFLCCGLSFITGDILLAVGNSMPVWVVGGFLSNIFLPVFSANNNYLWRTTVPIELHGRAFALKYALQCGTNPLGMLIGGALADYAFEPFMIKSGGFLSNIFGSSNGSGMAFMFFITGIVGTAACMMGFFSRTLREAENKGGI